MMLYEFAAFAHKVLDIPLSSDDLRFYITHETNHNIFGSKYGNSRVRASVWLAYKMCTTRDRTHVTISNNMRDSDHTMEIVRTIIDNIPEIISSGIRVDNKKRIELHNGCILIQRTDDVNSCRGMSISCLHLHNTHLMKDFDELYRCVYPTMVSSPTSQLMITGE